MKRQKGQDIVEFALLLPIFLLVLCGIIYCGFMFGDYQTVQGIVRNAAREAAVVEPTKDEMNRMMQYLGEINAGENNKGAVKKILDEYNRTPFFKTR